MKNIRLIVILFLLPVIACQSNDDPALDVELHSFWISPGEERALEEIVKAGRERNLNINVITHKDYDVLRNQIADRLAIGYPPDSSHWLASEDLSSAISNQLIMPIPITSNSKDITEVLHEDVHNQIVHDDEQVYLLPVGIHIMNSTVYNMPLLNSLGLTSPPDNWDDFFIMAERAADAGILPVALYDNPWLLRLLFTSILVSIDGQEPLDMIFNRKVRDNVKLIESFEKSFKIFLKLRDLADRNHPDRYWADSTNMVIKGEAVMQFIGDFARSEIITLAEQNIDDYECVAPPGNPTVIWDFDVFLFYKTGKPTEKQIVQSLTDTVLDPQAQENYIYYKGGLSVLRNASKTHTDSCAQSSRQRWASIPRTKIYSPFERNLLAIPILRHTLPEIWRDKNIVAKDASAKLYNALYPEK